MTKPISLRLFLLICGLAVTLASCSSIINGSTQKVVVNSEPAEADVMVNGRFGGKTPAELILRRGKHHLIEIRKEGFQTARITTGESIEPIYILNILIWPGFIVDILTGSAWGVDPEDIYVHLDSNPSK